MKRRILVVEDDPDNAEVLRHQLEFLGYDPIVARNGSQGIDLAFSEGPDLIIMDIMLPKTTGLEAIGKIRTNPETRLIPIVAATAMAMPGDRERCLMAGCDAYLAKPFTHVELRYLIDKLLSPY